LFSVWFSKGKQRTIMPLMTPDTQDSPADTSRSGKWWNATLVSILVTISVFVLIIIVAPNLDKSGDDFERKIIVWGSEIILLFVAAPVSIVLATISFIKKEEHDVGTSIVVLPCLALLALGLCIFVMRGCQGVLSAQDDKLYEACLAQIKTDSEIALKEHWPTSLDTPKGRAFSVAVGSWDVLEKPEVQFSASQVERIYAEVPSFREMVFKQAACTPEFISTHFQEAFDLARMTHPNMLVNILDNPHTPVQLVQRVVFFRKQLPSEPLYVDGGFQAGQVLWDHQSDMPADPRGNLQPYAREAGGKFFVLTLEGNNFRTLAGGGSRKFPDRDVNSYVPGVPQDFDLMQLDPDKLVFLPGVYSEDTAVHTQQLHLAEAFALGHNQQVFRQKTGKQSSP
jgi:hypothetical protein